jgi:transcriptional regulator with XRE-family HTH domain
MAYGRYLRQARERRGLTRLQVAHQVGCSDSLIHQIESENRPPSAALIENLVQAYLLSTTVAEAIRQSAGEHRSRHKQRGVPIPEGENKDQTQINGRLRAIAKTCLRRLPGRDAETYAWDSLELFRSGIHSSQAFSLMGEKIGDKFKALNFDPDHINELWLAPINEDAGLALCAGIQQHQELFPISWPRQSFNGVILKPSPSYEGAMFLLIDFVFDSEASAQATARVIRSWDGAAKFAGAAVLYNHSSKTEFEIGNERYDILSLFNREELQKSFSAEIILSHRQSIPTLAAV